MKKQLIGKGLIFFAMLALGAFGLLAGQPSGDVTFEIASPARPTKSTNEALEGGASPRECDLKRGVDTGCTFL